MLLRVALTLPRQPAVHFVFLGAGGGSSTHERVSKLRQALAPGGALAAYAQFAVDAFDAFGKPFNKLRAAAPKRRVDKKGEKPCEGPNIADCPPRRVARTATTRARRTRVTTSASTPRGARTTTTTSSSIGTRARSGTR